ncbi:hypothetical protein EOA25_09565 [Mesorhizobium sp. M2A.F.Ca.ET.040.01.1.1]|nr:hypothetical protein EOA25_09565 [Mesorhizobium sp. M2A.F.Ca.ET.040.01.1.1]
MLEHKAHVTVIVGKQCMSAALNILMGGHRRLCQPDSVFMIHAPSHQLDRRESRYTAAELRRLADQLEERAEDILEHLSCIKPEHRPFIEQALMSFEGEVFGVEKAKELGLIHATVDEG